MPDSKKTINKRRSAELARAFRSKKLVDQITEALKSPVLNGGFSTLLSKVERIEQSQEHMSETQAELKLKVDGIHDAIYDPNDGIFFRIHEQNAIQSAHAAQLNEWRQSTKENNELLSTKLDLSAKDIDTLKSSVSKIESSRSKLFSVIKWIAIVTFGTILSAFATLGVKAVWDMFF